MARYSRVKLWAWICSASFWWAVSFLATISKPLVSLSMRWTIPGRITPLMPESLSPQWYSKALTKVPSGFPGAGWTTMPWGLFTTSKSPSS